MNRKLRENMQRVREEYRGTFGMLAQRFYDVFINRDKTHREWLYSRGTTWIKHVDGKRKVKREDLESQLLEAQKGCCLFCGEKLSKAKSLRKGHRGLVLDHCHITGLIRGVSHRVCNHWEGLFWGAVGKYLGLVKAFSGSKQQVRNYKRLFELAKEKPTLKE